ncbi:MAG: polysaccharide pyruvyl transferase family protein [Ruminococcus bromii]|nr:polysaccharide pyruvyl transferase family protein [Ruminococcus bromii]MDD6433482.1 polysaccharide pyruvyl transferase family protein [Ruminococcus bromii]MDY4712103.1 polysaccharide pyruvyl transferase family protein [Ruminococcus bromii]
MKKLGICACYQHKNYGSQLQSYATTVELARRNIDFEVIRYKKKITPLLLVKSLPRLLNPVFINDRIIETSQKKMMLKLHPQLAQDNAVRNAAFDKFSQSRFKKLSPVYYGYEQLKEQSKKYTAVMVGSDQLWSPSGITSNFYNLMFADDNTVKISYATSFGVSQINPKYHKIYNTFLNRLDFISVRENSGKKIVEELSSNKAEVVCDPVILLDAEQWLKEIPNKRLYDEPYIFAYFLGKSAEYRDAVTKFAKQKGLKIVTEPHMDSYNKADENFGDYTPFDIGPAEFVNLIRNAEYVFTDSFHGSVFSMLYQKQFLVFNRYSDNSSSSKNSRIDSFCKNYGLSDRRYNGNIANVENEINYEAVLGKVDEHRQKSKAFLDKALACFDNR